MTTARRMCSTSPRSCRHSTSCSYSPRALAGVHRALAGARTPVAEDPFNLIVLGEFKRSKSSLTNALLDRDVLPAARFHSHPSGPFAAFRCERPCAVTSHASEWWVLSTRRFWPTRAAPPTFRFPALVRGDPCAVQQAACRPRAASLRLRPPECSPSLLPDPSTTRPAKLQTGRGQARAQVNCSPNRVVTRSAVWHGWIRPVAAVRVYLPRVSASLFAARRATGAALLVCHIALHSPSLVGNAAAADYRECVDACRPLSERGGQPTHDWRASRRRDVRTGARR